MNIPGFTADASLSTTTGWYQPIWNQSGGAGEQQVSPQQLSEALLRIPSRWWASYCWELHCFRESHVGDICVWRNRCLGE